MNGKFGVVSYELFAQAQGEVMIAKLVKDTEVQSSGIVVKGVQNQHKTGFAGTLELYIYDKQEQERIKRNLGKEIEVKLSV